MMLEFKHPLPVATPLGEGYAIYVSNGGEMENDIFCVVLDDSRILHFRSNDLLYVGNATLGLGKPTSRLAAVSKSMAEKRKSFTTSGQCNTVGCDQSRTQRSSFCESHQ